jgi:hypothetical protein
MAILHIEHAISDFAVWTAAFGRLAERRRSAGVRHEQVCRPVDDPHYVLVELDFPTVQQAQAFLQFLIESVWSSSDSSPALSGKPFGRVLLIEHRA